MSVTGAGEYDIWNNEEFPTSETKQRTMDNPDFRLNEMGHMEWIGVITQSAVAVGLEHRPLPDTERTEYKLRTNPSGPNIIRSPKFVYLLTFQDHYNTFCYKLNMAVKVSGKIDSVIH